MAAKKITLKHRLPDGAIGTRNTAREYSHVVVMRRDLKVIREQQGRISKNDAGSFYYLKSIAAAGVGNYGEYNPGERCHFPTTQNDFDRACKAIEGCTTAQEYAEKCSRERLAKHDAEFGDAPFGKWFIAGWCGRKDLAEKLAQKERSSGWAPADVLVEAINGGV